MARFILLLLIAGAIAFAATNRISLSALDPSPVGTSLEGREVVRISGQVEARFSRMGRVEETFMLFGGDARQRPNQITHAHLAGLPLRHARAIASSYPDFHLCKSPGAQRAQSYVEPTDFVALDRSTRATLIDALNLFKERLQSGGERTCVKVRGSAIALTSVREIENDLDLSDQMLPAFAKSQFVLAEEASIVDCQPLLR